MKENGMCLRIFAAVGLTTAALLSPGSVAAQSVSPTMPRPNRNTAQSLQRPQAPQPQKQLPGSTAPQPMLQQPGAGSVEGFVYWDANKIAHKPASSCGGLAITVSVGSSSGGPLTAYTPIGTLSNNFKYVGQVKQFLVGGKVNVYDVCTYGFDHVPVGPNLQVKLTVTQPSAFSPYAAPQSAILGPIKIINGKCNMLPQIVNPTASDLSAHWGSCQNMAYDVNFPMQVPTRVLGSGGLTSANQTGMLSGGSQQAMLAPDTTQGVQPQPAAGMLLGNRLTTQNAPGNGQFTGGLKVGGSGGLSGQIKTSSLPPSTTPGNYVPTMPPMRSSPKRDAASPADAATKAQIKSKLQAQLSAAIQATGRSVNPALKPAESNTPEIQALQQQKIFVNALRTQGAQTKGMLVRAPAPNLALHAPTASSNPIAHAPQPTQICLAPQIHAVNGKTSGVVFTQDPAYNDYIITGCHFGTQGGQVYLSGAVTGGRIDLVVKQNQWSDTQIEAVVEPGLTGVLDGWPDLMVVPNGGTPAKFANSRFYAQRQSVLLAGIPQQYATLANVAVGDSTHGFGTKYCPGPDVGHLFPCVAFNAGPPLDGITNGHDHRNDPSQAVSNAVDRDGEQMQFDAGEDVYDLSHMVPGFIVDYPMVYWYAWTMDVCEGWASDATPKKAGDSVGYDTQGHYSFYKKTNTKVVVDWGVDHCAWRWLGVFKVDDWYNSGYSLAVYVKGPIGVDPWTGRPIRNIGQAQPNRVVQMH